MSVFITDLSLLLGSSLRAVLCVVILILIIKRILDSFRKDPRLVKFAGMLPGPYAFPVIGNGDLGLAIDKVDITTALQKYEQKFGSRYRLWLGKYLVVVLSDLKDLQVVFGSSKMLDKSKFLDPPREFWGDGLFTAPMGVWKKSRKELQPFFVKNGVMLGYIPEMNRLIYNCVAEMKKHANGEEFDLWNVLPDLSFNIITRLLFDIELSPEEKSDLQFANWAHRASQIFLYKMFKPWTQLTLIDYLLFSGVRAQFHSRMSRLTNLILKNKLAGELSNVTPLSTKSGSSFLQTVLQLKEKLDVGEKYIKDEIITALAAGTDTAAITLAFCILAIAMHSEVQNKLHEELWQIFGDDDREANVEDIENLPYLDQVIKEAQRRFTLAPVLFRNVEEDSKIGPYIYPSGTALMVPVGNIHLNSNYYPNPLKFNPENFSSEAVSKRPKLTFMPFSTGARNCIGKALAELEMKLTLTALLRTFVFRTNMKMEDIKLLPGFVILSADGYKVSISLRDRPQGQ